MAEVALHNVKKRFDEVERRTRREPADPGQGVRGLVGPPGAARATTLRMIADWRKSVCGDIVIGGDVVNDVPPKDAILRCVPELCALSHMTVFENIHSD